MVKRRKKSKARKPKKSPGVRFEPKKSHIPAQVHVVSDSSLKTAIKKFEWSLELFDFTNNAWGFNEKLYKQDWCKEILPKRNLREEDT